MKKKQKLLPLKTDKESRIQASQKGLESFKKKHGITLSEHVSKKAEERRKTQTKEQWIERLRIRRSRPIISQEFGIIGSYNGKRACNQELKPPKKMFHKNLCSACQGSGEWREGIACNRCEGSGWEPSNE